MARIQISLDTIQQVDTNTEVKTEKDLIFSEVFFSQ